MRPPQSIGWANARGPLIVVGRFTLGASYRRIGSRRRRQIELVLAQSASDGMPLRKIKVTVSL